MKKRTLLLIGFLFIPLLFSINIQKSLGYNGGVHKNIIYTPLNSNDVDIINVFDMQIHLPGMHDFYNELLMRVDNDDAHYVEEIISGDLIADENALARVSHAWNPETREGMLDVPGAPWSCYIHFDQAVTNYRQSLVATNPTEIISLKSDAYYELGHALHFVQDLTVPYHAVSTTDEDGIDEYDIIGFGEDYAGPHKDYEILCDNIMDNIAFSNSYTIGSFIKELTFDQLFITRPTGLLLPSYRTGYLSGFTPGAFVHNAALAARDKLPYITTFEYSYDPEDSTTYPSGLVVEAERLIKKAHEMTFYFLYYFWNCVNDNIDYDNDGLTGYQEYNYKITHMLGPHNELYDHIYSLNPFNDDTDNDGLPDKFEIDNGLDPLIPDPIDYDGDGLLNRFEIDNSLTNPLSADSDGDGLSDKDEWDSSSDPNDADSDDDYLDDGEEALYQTDPNDKDSDNDGFWDSAEIQGIYHTQYNKYITTNPNCADTDSDCLSDYFEFYTSFTDPTKYDSDGEGLGDFQEYYSYGTNPNKVDTDGEGLSDYREVMIEGTNPKKQDTDGDGWNDYQEVVVYHTDPLDSSNNPYNNLPPGVPRNFSGSSNGVNRITLSWSRPSNYISGWKFRVYRWTGSYWSQIYYGTSLSIYYYPPSVYTLYTYKVYCYNGNDQPGPYASLSMKVKSSGSGGGPEFMDYRNDQLGTFKSNQSDDFSTLIPFITLITFAALSLITKKKWAQNYYYYYNG